MLYDITQYKNDINKLNDEGISPLGQYLQDYYKATYFPKESPYKKDRDDDLILLPFESRPSDIVDDVMWFIENGADLNCDKNAGALWEAVLSCDIDMVFLLFEKGAKPRIPVFEDGDDGDPNSYLGALDSRCINAMVDAYSENEVKYAKKAAIAIGEKLLEMGAPWRKCKCFDLNEDGTIEVHEPDDLDFRRELNAEADAVITPYNILMRISECYSSGVFDKLYPYLADDCVWESQWRWDPEIGKDAVTKYYEAKGKALRESGRFPKCTIVKLVGSLNPVEADNINVNGERHSGYLGLLYDDEKLCLYMGQRLDGKENGVILDMTLNDENLISRIDICAPELFKFEPFSW